MTDRLPNKRIKPKALAPGAPRGDPSSASSTTEFRVFTISTKTALYDWMKDQMERKPDVYSRLPSRSYFYEILREFTKDGRVRFHRTTNFTKCDVCLWCRHHLGIGKHGSEFRDNVRRLRVLHLNHIASEVQCVFYTIIRANYYILLYYVLYYYSVRSTTTLGMHLLRTAPWFPSSSTAWTRAFVEFLT